MISRAIVTAPKNRLKNGANDLFKLIALHDYGQKVHQGMNQDDVKEMPSNVEQPSAILKNCYEDDICPYVSDAHENGNVPVDQSDRVIQRANNSSPHLGSLDYSFHNDDGGFIDNIYPDKENTDSKG